MLATHGFRIQSIVLSEVIYHGLPNRIRSSPAPPPGEVPPAAALFLAGVKIFWPEGQAWLTQLLLPAGTRAAFRDLLDALQSGQPFYDSLTAFCREIVSYADLPAA